jgi:hypothetical protein
MESSGVANAGIPQRAQTYTLDVQVEIMDDGLAPRRC